MLYLVNSICYNNYFMLCLDKFYENKFRTKFDKITFYYQKAMVLWLLT